MINHWDSPGTSSHHWGFNGTSRCDSRMRTDVINLKIYGEMLCLVNKLKDLKKEHPVSNHEKDFFLQNRESVVGFYVSFVCFFLCLGRIVGNHSFSWSSPPALPSQLRVKMFKGLFIVPWCRNKFLFLVSVPGDP